MNTLRYADRVKQIKRNLTATAIAEQELAAARKVALLLLVLVCVRECATK